MGNISLQATRYFVQVFLFKSMKKIQVNRLTKKKTTLYFVDLFPLRLKILLRICWRSQK